MAQDTHARLVGQRIVLSGKDGPFRVCPTCGCCEGRIGRGQGPHAASVACTGCGSHVSWLGAAHLAAFAARKGAA